MTTTVGWGPANVREVMRSTQWLLIPCPSLATDHEPDRTICTEASSERHVEQGDTRGGPLLIHDGEKWIQIGVPARYYWDEGGIPSATAYQEVTKYVDWIVSVTAPPPPLSVTIRNATGGA